MAHEAAPVGKRLLQDGWSKARRRVWLLLGAVVAEVQRLTGTPTNLNSIP